MSQLAKGGIVIIYSCHNCGFRFFRFQEAKACPACQSQKIRTTAYEEIEDMIPNVQMENTYLKIFLKSEINLQAKNAIEDDRKG